MSFTMLPPSPFPLTLRNGCTAVGDEAKSLNLLVFIPWKNKTKHCLRVVVYMYTAPDSKHSASLVFYINAII